MQINVVNHPVIKEKMTRLRDKDTPPSEFRRLLDQIAQLLLFEVTKDLPVREVKVTTPPAWAFWMRSWTCCRKPMWAISA